MFSTNVSIHPMTLRSNKRVRKQAKHHNSIELCTQPTKKQQLRAPRSPRSPRAPRVTIDSFIDNMVDGVYLYRKSYYTVYEGNISEYQSKHHMTRLEWTLGELRKWKLCDNSDLLLGLDGDFNRNWGDSYAHIKSARKDIDNYGRVVSADEYSLTFEVFDRTKSNRENGTREYDEESGYVEELEWKDIDDCQCMCELPFWTDSDPDSDSNEDEDDDY